MTKKPLFFWSMLAIIIIALLLFININTGAQQKDDSEDWPVFRLNLVHSGYKEGRAPNSNATDWIFDTPNTNRWVVSSPMIVDDYVYFGCDNGRVYKLDCNDGSEIWNYTASNGGYATFWSSPCVDKESGQVFVNVRGIHAIDIETGTLNWRYDTQESREFSSPVVHKGVVFFGSHNHNLYALPVNDPDESGVIEPDEVIWYYESGEYENGYKIEGTGGAIAATPAISNGIVFCAEQTRYGGDPTYCDYNVFALPEEDPDDSGVIEHDEIIWKYKIGEHLPVGDVHVPFTGGDIFSSPSVHGDVLFIGSNDQQVYALDINGDDDDLDNDGDGIIDNEGELIWSFDVGDEVFSTPSYHNGKVFFGSGGEDQAQAYIYALPEEDPDGDGRINMNEIKWRFQTDDRSLVSPLIADGKVFVGSNDYYVYALDEDDGTLIWSYETGNYIGSSPSLYEKKIYVGSCDSKLYTFKIENAKPHVYLLYPESDMRVSDSIELKWRGRDWDWGDQERLTYDVYLDTIYENVEKSEESSLVSKGQKEESFKPQLVEGETYYWKVVANDTQLEGESEIWSFKVNTKPILSEFSPPDNGRIFSNSTTLSWNGNDGDDDDLVYDVYFGDNAIPDNVSSDQEEEDYDVSDLEIGETYYWKIIVKDGIDNISSSLLIFKYNTPPEIELSSPSDKARVKATSLTLNWDGNDDDEDSLTHDVYLDTNSNPTIEAPDITEEYYSPSGLTDGETYYWKVIVNDGYQETESTIWQFTVNTPPTIDLSSPLYGVKVTSTSPTLFWDGNDDDEDSLTYDVYLDTDSEPKTLVQEDQIDEYYNAIGLTLGETYYWKTVVNDSYQKTESPIWKFTVNTPPIINLNSPSKEKRVVGTSVKLEWEGIDEDEEDDLTYNVYFDEDPMPKNKVSEGNNKNFYEKGNLEKGVKYYWKVVVNDGYEEITSEIRSITVNSQPLITLLNPENSEEISSTSVRLSWDAEDNENDELNFDVYLDKKINPEEKVSTSQKEYYYEAENLEIGETYYWKIVANDGYEHKTSVIWEFKVGEDATSGDGTGEAKASVSSNDISFSKSEIFDDEEITITVIVHNNVQETLESIEVWFFDGDPNNELLIHMEEVIIEANGIITVVAPWIAEKGSHTIYVVVDYQGVKSIAYKSISVKEKVEKDEDDFEIELLVIPSVIAVVIVIGIAIGVKKKSKKKSYKRCPNCSSKMEYVSKYRDYYCYECEEYLEDI